MTKKTFSLFLAICLLMTTLTILPTTAFAKSYADQLRDKGFPESYISKLVSLHNKYPKWDFQPLKTGLNFTAAVKAERSPHSKQLIERQSSLSAAYYCNCASCKNKPQEGSSWYSASQNAVMHYMDPRNFFDEKHIFQFESTAYNAKQTKAGVETILSPTWMHNSLINYLTTDGKTRKNYDSKTKYSDAILAAAKNSGMSAYYLASKIVQEVGSTKATTGGASGNRAPFIGIYNYYNIGAYSGAMDGLDALLATVQMPSGIPVATVALNGAKNAAWLAAEILALGDEALAGRLEAERTAMAQQIAAKEEKLQKEIEEL